MVQVSACEGNIPSGFTYLIPSEERLEAKIITRGYMESKLVVCMAGRCAESLLLVGLKWERLSEVGLQDCCMGRSSMQSGPVRQVVLAPDFNLSQGCLGQCSPCLLLSCASLSGLLLQMEFG